MTVVRRCLLLVMKGMFYLTPAGEKRAACVPQLCEFAQFVNCRLEGGKQTCRSKYGDNSRGMEFLGKCFVLPSAFVATGKSLFLFNTSL